MSFSSFSLWSNGLNGEFTNPNCGETLKSKRKKSKINYNSTTFFCFICVIGIPNFFIIASYKEVTLHTLYNFCLNKNKSLPTLTTIKAASFSSTSWSIFKIDVVVEVSNFVVMEMSFLLRTIIIIGFKVSTTLAWWDGRPKKYVLKIG